MNNQLDTAYRQIPDSNKLPQKSILVGDQVEVSGFYKPHDKFRIELKFEYQLNQGEPESDFLIESYLFIPQALGLTTSLIRSTDFFADIKSYMRYAVQPMDLSDLLDLTNSLSPMARINDFLLTGKVVERKNPPVNFFIHESKLITCIFKETVKIEFLKIEENIKNSTANPYAPAIAFHLLQKVYQQVLNVQKQFYKISELVSSSQYVSENEREGYAAVYEFFYYEMSLFFISIFEMIKQIEKTGHKCDDFLTQVIRERELFSKFAKVNKFIELKEESSDREREKYIYREGKLKKYVSSILFLNRDITSHKKTEEFFFAIAAGICMLFAVSIAVFAAVAWGVNSAPWMLSAVLAYMIRDRAKAWMQEKFRNIAPVYLAHRTQKLIEENVGNVGHLKEWLVFKTYEQMPADIMDVRTQGREMAGAFKKSEDILYYKKMVKLNNEIIHSNHQRINKVVNILRFNMKRFCASMDDPAKILKVIDETNEVVPILGRKVYHLNLIFKITSNFGKPNAVSERLNLKIIISRDGIERIESPYGSQMAKLFELTWFSGQV